MTNAAIPTPPDDARTITQRQCPDDLWALGERAVARARRWIDESSHEPTPRSAKLLSRILADPSGLTFTTRFVDDVVRPADLDAASAALQRLSAGRTDFLPPALAAAMGLGSKASRLAPRTVTAVARRVFREIVGDLVVDATDKGLGPALARLRKGGNRLNVNLLGEAVLGEKEAARRLFEVSRLVARDDVDYVSIKVSAVTGPHNPWGFEEVVAHGVSALLPLYRLARDSGTFVNLDMEDYKDLDLTLAVFTAILDQPDMTGYEAGIVLQAYLPDSLGALQQLQEWACKRVDAGGAPIKVRIVKGANLSMEKVDAQIHGWELTTWPSKQATDTNYKRMLEWAMTPERTRAIRLGIAGQNIFDIAFAYELRAARSVHDSVEFEMLSGMATGIQEVVRREVGSLLLYVPVVNPREFDVAISYLVRRLEENAAPENFMSGVFDIAADQDVFARERDRFLASLADLDPDACTPVPNRTQNRCAERDRGVSAEQGSVAQRARRPFVSEADSDPALAANRQWARDIAAAIPASTLGVDAVRTGARRLATDEQIDELVEASVRAAHSWQDLDPEERAAALHRVGDVLAARRAELIEVAGSEADKTIDQADPEVSEAIDFCHHYAAASLDLADEAFMVGARFVPVDVTVVASPWNFPVAIPVGGVAAALAAGSAVILKPAPPAKRCAAELVRAFHDAGVPEDLVALAPLEDGDVSRYLVTHGGVDRVVLTGSYETARLFRSWKPDMHLLGETSGKNAIIVTPSADPDLAVRDIVQSAFAHAGQKCSASSLLILVGSAGRSDRIARQLVDAASSLRVGLPASLDSQVGPVVVPDDEKAVRGLTTLGPGEHWVLTPRYLGNGLWTPGIRAGVVPGSEFHLTEYFAPVLGVMRVDTLQEAIDAVNAVDYGLTSGLHTLDSEELDMWLDGIEAGNLYVNRGITGAIVRRQPFGGWKRSAIGSTTKAGGPSYLLGLGEVEPAHNASTEAETTQALLALAPGVLALFEATEAQLSARERTELRRALNADAQAWASAYGANRDVTGLACERNILRYRPTPVLLRAGRATPLVDVVRVLAAGTLAGGPIGLSVAEALPQSLLDAVEAAGVEVSVEDADAWDARLAMVATSGGLGMRVRVLGPHDESSQERWAHASRVTGGSPDLALYTGAVTPCPHSELLPFVREQAVSMTKHRFGTPFDLAASLL